MFSQKCSDFSEDTELQERSQQHVSFPVFEVVLHCLICVQ